jgi:hypothetical protein
MFKKKNPSEKTPKPKAKKGIYAILEKLEPEVFFQATEDKQLTALDGLNKFITTREKMLKAVDSGMLDTITNLVKLANDYHLLPVPHARIMETTQILVAIPSLKVRFGVEANLCNVLVGEIQELVDSILGSVKEAEQRLRQDKRDEQLKALEKKGGVSNRPRAVTMMFTFVSGDQPIGITVGVPPLTPKGGVIEKIQYGSQASGVDEKEWNIVKQEIEDEKKLLDEEAARVKENVNEKIVVLEEQQQRKMKAEKVEKKRFEALLKLPDSPALKVGDEIVKINKTDVQKKTNFQIQKMLAKAKRPVSVYFKGLRSYDQLNGMFWKLERERIDKILVEEKDKAFKRRREDAEKAKEKEQRVQEQQLLKEERKRKRKAELAKKEKEGMDYMYEVVFGEGPLGMALKEPKNGGKGVIIHEITPDGQAARNGAIKVGHRPVRIGDQLVVKLKVKEILQIIKKSKRPLTMKLKGREKLRHPGDLISVVFYKGPMGMKLVERTGKPPLGNGVAVGHVQQNGYAERSGDIEIGYIINKIGPEHKKDGPMVDVRHFRVANLLKLIQTMKRPVVIEFLVPDYDIELAAALEYERKEEEKKREDARIRKEPNYTVTLTKKPHGIVLEPYILPGAKDENIKSAGARIKHILARSEGASLKPRRVRAGDKILKINDKKVGKRPLSFVNNLLRKSAFPMTLVLHRESLHKVREAEAIPLGPLEKRFLVEEPEGGLELTHIDEDYSVGIGLARIAGSRVGAKVEAVSDKGDAKKLGIQRDWNLVRIAGVSVKEMQLNDIKDLLRDTVRPYVLDFDVVTLKQKLQAAEAEKPKAPDAEAAAKSKKKKSSIMGKLTKPASGGGLKKGRMNVRSLLWSAAPKALPQPPLTTEGEGMVELIPEYAKPLAELIKNDVCKDVTASGTTFATLANVLKMFFKIKSRSESLVRPSVLKMCTNLTATPKGLKAFINTNKLVGTWIGFLWDAQNDPLVLHDLILQLHRIVLSPNIEEHEEYQSLFVARSVVNMLNASHGTFFRDKSGAGLESYIRLLEILLHIIDDPQRLKLVLNSYYHKPGLPGLWNMLSKCRVPPVLQRTMRLLRLLTIDRDGILYSAYSKGVRPASAGEPPGNVLNMLIMALNRAKLNHGGFEYEYDFKPGPIGLRLDVAPGKRSGTIVKGVTKDGQADRAGVIEPGDILLRVGKKNVEKFPLDRAMDELRIAPRPVTLEFRKPNMNAGKVEEYAKYSVRYDSTAPIGLKLVHLADGENGARIQFIQPESQSSANPKIKVGHVMFAVGDIEVYTYEYQKVIKTMKQAKRPVLVTFVDPLSRSEEEKRADEIMLDVATIIVKVIENDQKLEEEIELNPEAAADIRAFHEFHDLKVEDATLILELIFQRMLKQPPPSREFVNVAKDALVMCARTDYVQTSSLYIPAFLHLNHLDEGEVQPDYDVYMIQTLVVNVTKLIDECPEIAVRIGRAGGLGTALRSFNRLQQAAEKGEDEELTTLENEIIRWNKSMTDLLEEVIPHRNDKLSDIIQDTAPSLIANLFLVSMWCETVSHHEKDRLHSFIEHADEDGDGNFDIEKDNPAFAEEIRCCQERIKLINSMEAQIYAIIFEGCRVHKSCQKEIADPKFLPSIMDAIVQMTKSNNAEHVKGLYSLAHLLSMITVDESHVVLLFTPPGALTLCTTVLKAFEYIVETETLHWKNLGLSEHIIAESHGGQEQATIACMAQVLVQVLRVVDIKEDLDKSSDIMLSTPMLEIVVKLLQRTLRQASMAFISEDMHKRAGPEFMAYVRCQQSLILVLYEYSTMEAFRQAMSKLEVPRACLDVLVNGRGIGADTMVACAGTTYNIMLDSKARVVCQDYSKGSVLYDMSRMFHADYAKSVHMKALLVASVRSIVDSTRIQAVTAASKMRHLIPILIELQDKASNVPEPKMRKKGGYRPHSQADQMILTAATEARELIRILTHIKYSELRLCREAVITGRKHYAAGTMSLSTLKTLHEKRMKKLQAERGYQDPLHAKGKKPHLGKVVADENDLEEDHEETFFNTGTLNSDALERRLDVAFNQYGEIENDGKVLKRIAIRNEFKSKNSDSSPTTTRKTKKQSKEEEEEEEEGDNYDIVAWTDIEYDSLMLRESDYDRSVMVTLEREEDHRHEALLDSNLSDGAGHSKFMSGHASTYVENITTISKQAESIFENIGYGISPRAQQESFKYLPKVEVGSTEFSKQQEAIRQKQIQERSHVREELLKLRTAGHEFIGHHETIRDRDYHIDRNALKGLAKEMVWGKKEAKSPRRDSTLGGKLPNLSQMGRRSSFGRIPNAYDHHIEKGHGKYGESSPWKSNTAPESKQPNFVAPSPKLRFLKTAPIKIYDE